MNYDALVVAPPTRTSCSKLALTRSELRDVLALNCWTDAGGRWPDFRWRKGDGSIFVASNGGSNKTWLAGELAAKLRLPLTHLDDPLVT